MIIECPCHKKKFEIDATLIPKEGRELQCGSCGEVWFYKIEKKIPEPIITSEEKILNEDAVSSLNNITSEEKTLNEDAVSSLNDEIQTDENSKKNKIEGKLTKIKKTENNAIGKFFSYLIVFIISMVAVVILMDTIKKPLIDIFPGLEMILYNLYETLKDIKLFIIDLS